jgi:uncharacterized LabA/DUF88 family protein
MTISPSALLLKDATMYFGPNPRVALFIDGHFLYTASRNLGFDVDYRNLLELFRKQGLLVRAYYYAAVLENDEYSPVKPLTDWLAYNGYTLVTKPAKEHTDADGRRRVRGNMEPEIICDMFEMAPRVTHLVVFSGNGDLLEAVKRVQRNAQVMVVATIKTTSPPLVSDELRRQVDEFVELADIAEHFTRRRTEPREVRPLTPTLTPANPFGGDVGLPEVVLAPKRRRTATG